LRVTGERQMQTEAFRTDILELLSYMITSARGLVDEPRRYGPFRLVEAAGRLVALLERAGIEDEFLHQLAAMIYGRDPTMGSGEDEWVGFLDDLVLMLTRELKRM
jgi:hypothetical protein